MSSNPTERGPRTPTRPFDLGVMVSGLVKHDDHSLLVAGRRLKLARDQEPEMAVERYRRAIVTELLAQHPEMDDAGWQSFVNAVVMQLRDKEYADNRTLDSILHAIGSSGRPNEARKTE
jgi:hypothetical protein